MTTIEVEIFSTLIVPHLATFGAYGDDIKEGIDIKKIHGLIGLEARGLEVKTCVLGKSKEEVHVLNGLTCGTLDKVVDE